MNLTVVKIHNDILCRKKQLINGFLWLFQWIIDECFISKVNCKLNKCPQNHFEWMSSATNSLNLKLFANGCFYFRIKKGEQKKLYDNWQTNIHIFIKICWIVDCGNNALRNAKFRCFIVPFDARTFRILMLPNHKNESCVVLVANGNALHEKYEQMHLSQSFSTEFFLSALFFLLFMESLTCNVDLLNVVIVIEWQKWIIIIWSTWKWEVTKKKQKTMKTSFVKSEKQKIVVQCNRE